MTLFFHILILVSDFLERKIGMTFMRIKNDASVTNRHDFREWTFKRKQCSQKTLVRTTITPVNYFYIIKKLIKIFQNFKIMIKNNCHLIRLASY